MRKGKSLAWIVRLPAVQLTQFLSASAQCGVPKKGHVCPYQPKVKRRPDEPPPQTRNAAVQVEMDEFMTLRRLNVRIQGFPESYASEPYLEPMVTGEPRCPPLPPDDAPDMETTETSGV